MKMTVILLLFICFFSSSSITINKVTKKNICIDTISVYGLIEEFGMFESISPVNKQYHNQITEKYIYFKLDTIFSNAIYITNIYCKNSNIELLKFDNSKLDKKDTLLINGLQPSFKVKHRTTNTKLIDNWITFDLVLPQKKSPNFKIAIEEGFNFIDTSKWLHIDSKNSHKKYTIHRKNGFKNLLATLHRVLPNTVIVFDKGVDSIFWKNNVNLYDNTLYFYDEKNLINFSKLPNREYNFFYMGCSSAGNFTIEVVD